MIKHQNWNYPTAIRFGPGRLHELSHTCLELGIKRPLIVTDPGLAKLPLMKAAMEACADGGTPANPFHDIQGNPVGANIDAGIQCYKETDSDGVIALGGGSALDAGKAIAFMVGQNRPIWDFEDREDWWTRANEAGIAPIVAVPTTSGTGSEVGRAAVITDEQSQTKKIIFHPKMLPSRVLLDPTTTLGMPPSLTAAVGMDALSHALEAYCSPVYHPLAHGIAVEAMRLIRSHLVTAFEDGANLTARAHLQVAAMMGATAFQKGLGAMHAMSHPCGAILNTHHGLTNAVVMPYVLEFNRSAIAVEMAHLAQALDLPTPGLDGVIQWVLQLRETLAIPKTLSEIGVRYEHIEQLAPMALGDPSGNTNPVSLSLASVRQLFGQAISGPVS